MPYPVDHYMGDINYDPATDLPMQAIPGFTPDQGGGPGIDWTDVITTGETIVGGILNPNAQQTYRYPVYTPTSSALSSLTRNPMMLVLVLGGLYLATRKR